MVADKPFEDRFIIFRTLWSALVRPLSLSTLTLRVAAGTKVFSGVFTELPGETVWKIGRGLFDGGSGWPQCQNSGFLATY
jgi:hypothetical protein